MDWHFLISNSDSDLIRMTVGFTMAVSVGFFMYVWHRYKNLQSIKSRNLLIGSFILVFAAGIMFLQHLFTHFWYVHFALYISIKGFGGLLLLLGCVFCFRGWDINREEKLILLIILLSLLSVTILLHVLLWYAYRTTVEANLSNAENYSKQGFSYMRDGKYEKATSYLRKAVAMEPENASYRLELAATLEVLGNKKESVEQLMLGLKYADGDALQYYNASLILERLGKYSRAITILQTALDLHKDETIVDWQGGMRTATEIKKRILKQLDSLKRKQKNLRRNKMVPESRNDTGRKQRGTSK